MCYPESNLTDKCTRTSFKIMAERSTTQEALEKVESGLECGICLDTYREPKVLPCFHVFCLECLKKSVEKNKEKKTLSCPTCRRSIPLPTNGIEGIQCAFHINHLFEIRDTLTKTKDSANTKCEKCEEDLIATGYCQDCGEYVCDDCKRLHTLWKKQYGQHTIVSLTEIQIQAANLVPPKRNELFCQKHPEERLKIFCETCQEVACFYCTICDHQTHKHDTVQNSFQTNREELDRELLLVKAERERLMKATKVFDERVIKIAENEANIGAEIQRRIDHYYQLLHNRKTELLTQLKQTAQQKQKRLATQRESVNLRLAQIDNCIGYVEGSLKTDSYEEILSVKANTLKQLHFLRSDIKDNMIQPQEDATLTLGMTDLDKTCQKLGEVLDGIPVCPEKCSIFGDDIATVDERKDSTLKLVGATGEDITISPGRVVTKLVKTSDLTVVKCSVSEMQRSQCHIQYTPKKRGKHQLHVMVNGKLVKRSPLSVVVMPALTCLQKPVTTFRNLRGAWGVGITSIGHLVVAESNANRVTILTQDGKKISSFGTKGSANGQFNYPGGIAIDSDDNIYVADARNNRIQKFRIDGTFKAVVGGQGENQLNAPYGVSFNKLNGYLYVCDTKSNRIQVLTTELECIKIIGTQGAMNEQLREPCDVAFDSKGNIYAADSGNNCVKVFTAAGQYSYTIGANRLKTPYGLTVDAAGRVYVAEHTIHQISIFTQAGEYIQSIASVGKSPLRIVIDTENINFFVSAFSTNNVLMF